LYLVPSDCGPTTVPSNIAEPDGARTGTSRRPGARPFREPELDGLRGMAALMVALLHCLFAVGMPSELREGFVTGLAGAVANGTSAVILFFVLSGYVLAASFARDASPRGAVVFYAKRLLRIYPAYVVAVATAWLASFVYPWLEPGPGVGSSVRTVMAADPEPAELLRHLVVPGMAGLLLPQGWTIPIELALSFALPVLFLLALRLGGALLAAAAGLGVVLTDAAPVEYAFPFVLGVLASVHAERISRAVSRGLHANASLTVGVVLFFLPTTTLRSVSVEFGIVVVSAGALALVLLVRRVEALRRVAGSRLASRLGEISYGFYLLHYTVIALVAPLMLSGGEAMSAEVAMVRWLGLAAVVVPVAGLLAAASWRWLEAPAIAAGRRLGRLHQSGRDG
jgi:peptidoglycan/LPS O-acetylase OafA/YrhL